MVLMPLIHFHFGDCIDSLSLGRKFTMYKPVNVEKRGPQARKKVTLKWKFAKNFANAPRTSSLMKIC